jgi:hypothetical protein
MIASFIPIFQPMFVRATNDDGRWWDKDFAGISLSPIASHGQTQQGSVAVILYVSGDSTISADNSITSQLRNATDGLVTEYKLEFDGDGGSNTGAANTLYAEYNSFLSTPVEVRHAPGDDDVVVTLWVKASNRPDNVADSGLYNATQTLTISW